MMRNVLGAVVCGVALAAGLVSAEPPAANPPPKHPMAVEHPIVVNATAIVPPRYWSVPGVTEPLQSVRDRMTTDKVATLQLRPGRYMFTTTAFSFEFTVDLDGVLDYSKQVAQCVEGRGTTTLVVKCHRMGNAVGPD